MIAPGRRNLRKRICNIISEIGFYNQTGVCRSICSYHIVVCIDQLKFGACKSSTVPICLSDDNAGTAIRHRVNTDIIVTAKLASVIRYCIFKRMYLRSAFRSVKCRKHFQVALLQNRMLPCRLHQQPDRQA